MPDDSALPRPADAGRRGYLAAAAAAIIVLGAAIWLSTRLHPSPAVHSVALFAHLASLILGFGAIMVADYFFVLWVLRRTTFREAVANTSRLHVLVWTGLVGLVTSGVLLQPNLASGTTILKLGFVAALTLNGLQAMALGRRMSTLDGNPPVTLLLWGGLTSAISQICWWGAIIIGFLNVNR
jgi:hypothetical protein